MIRFFAALTVLVLAFIEKPAAQDLALHEDLGAVIAAGSICKDISVNRVAIGNTIESAGYTVRQYVGEGRETWKMVLAEMNRIIVKKHNSKISDASFCSRSIKNYGPNGQRIAGLLMGVE